MIFSKSVTWQNQISSLIATIKDGLKILGDCSYYDGWKGRIDKLNIVECTVDGSIAYQ